jgi:hypothetical protein
VPELVALVIEHSPVLGRHHPALGVHVREIGDLRRHLPVLGDAGARLLQRTEAPAEGDLLGVVPVLVVEDEHRVLLERGANGLERRVVERAELDARDLGHEARVQPADAERHASPPAWQGMRPGGS